MTKYLAIVLVIAALAAAGLGYLLKLSYEENGKLKESNAQLQATVKAKSNATLGRAKTDSDVRKLPPAGVLDRLR